MVDKSVDALLRCGESYLNDPEIIFMLVTSLMKLAGKDMSSRQKEIGEFMKRVETSSDYFTHKIAEGITVRYR